jgi:5-methylcytosine-specific restriction endonuclease McrA
MRVLALNADYTPLHIISDKRAVLLVLGDDADMVEPSDKVFRSQHTSVVVPSVIRLRKYRKVPYRRRVALTTRAVLRRDDRVCCYCGGEATTRDHVVPTARGGKDVWGNVVAACKPCNNRKNDRLLSEIGWGMLFEPIEPTGEAHYSKLAADSRPEWQQYFAPFLNTPATATSYLTPAG